MNRQNPSALSPPRAAGFIEAQDLVYSDMLAELRAGKKQSHWMWYIFPQLKKLGQSPIAKRFGIEDMKEAKAYAAHAVLGGRLRQCVALTLAIDGRTARQVFGSPDDLKFRSCLTLFFEATGEDVFRQALQKYFAGKRDPATLAAL